MCASERLVVGAFLHKLHSAGFLRVCERSLCVVEYVVKLCQHFSFLWSVFFPSCFCWSAFFPTCFYWSTLDLSQSKNHVFALIPVARLGHAAALVLAATEENRRSTMVTQDLNVSHLQAVLRTQTQLIVP